jgi:hypothetical protein
MTEPDRLILVANVILFVTACGLALLVAWAFRGVLPKELRAKYPTRVIRMSQLPFTEKWRLSIEQKDLPLILKARRRQHGLLLGMMFLTYVKTVHAHLYTIAALHSCLLAHWGRASGG